MDGRSFQQFFEHLRGLPRDQVLELADAVRAIATRPRAAEIIETARFALLKCPACQRDKPYRNGHANGLQRFRCRQCGRTFNSLTGTPLARLRHKDKWLAYCDTLLDPATTVRRSAEQLGVHPTTTFRWRHRMLIGPRRDHQTPLQGLVEADAMHLPESHKGARRLERPARARGGKRAATNDHVCVLVARDRDGRTHDAVTGMGRLKAAQLIEHLAPALDKDVLLVTHAPGPYRPFADQLGIRHASATHGAGDAARAELHLQNVSGYLDRLRTWLAHFHGVATRYLDNYCGWRRAIDGPRINSPEAFLRAAAGVFHSQREQRTQKSPAGEPAGLWKVSLASDQSSFQA